MTFCTRGCFSDDQKKTKQLLNKKSGFKFLVSYDVKCQRSGCTARLKKCEACGAGPSKRLKQCQMFSSSEQDGLFEPPCSPVRLVLALQSCEGAEILQPHRLHSIDLWALCLGDPLQGHAVSYPCNVYSAGVDIKKINHACKGDE